MFVFQKIWHALFPCNLRFEIRPCALSPTTYVLHVFQIIYVILFHILAYYRVQLFIISILKHL